MHILKPHYATTASFDGNTFLNMDFEATGELTGDEFEQVKVMGISIVSGQAVAGARTPRRPFRFGVIAVPMDG